MEMRLQQNNVQEKLANFKREFEQDVANEESSAVESLEKAESLGSQPMPQGQQVPEQASTKEDTVVEQQIEPKPEQRIDEARH